MKNGTKQRNFETLDDYISETVMYKIINIKYIKLYNLKKFLGSTNIVHNGSLGISPYGCNSLGNVTILSSYMFWRSTSQDTEDLVERLHHKIYSLNQDL